jgi:uncharacterized membrane protein YeaQ/YmgE (transglycosylase-associated protein family)
MSIVEFIVLVIIAALSGALGQALVGRSLGGWLITTLVGFIGAVLGRWMATSLGLPILLPINLGGQTFPVIWAVVGAALLAMIPGLINRVRAELNKK